MSGCNQRTRKELKKNNISFEGSRVVFLFSFLYKFFVVKWICSLLSMDIDIFNRTMLKSHVSFCVDFFYLYVIALICDIKAFTSTSSIGAKVKISGRAKGNVQD